ncbi:MAG: hypothetical protein U0935_18160 [Pirellulales bacterium]
MTTSIRRPQLVRNLWSKIGCWNLCGWLYTLAELASWDRPATPLIDRAERPGGKPARRPSPADRHPGKLDGVIHDKLV